MPYSNLGAISKGNLPNPYVPTYESPAVGNLRELVTFFHELTVNFFQFVEPARGERDWDDIFVGERYGYLSPPAYEPDSQFGGSLVHKVLRYTMLYREAFETEMEANVGAAAIALNIDHGMAQIKQLFPHDFGLVWDVILEGGIQPYIMASIREPTLWTVELSCQPLVRIIVRDDIAGGHEAPPTPVR